MKRLREGLRWLALGLVLAGCVTGLVGLNGTRDAAEVLAAFLRFVVLAGTGLTLGLAGGEILGESANQPQEAEQRDTSPPDAAPQKAPEQDRKPAGTSETTQRAGRSSRRRRNRRRPARTTNNPDKPKDGETPLDASPDQPLRLADVIYPTRDHHADRTPS